jgi:group I intron endonuclease
MFEVISWLPFADADWLKMPARSGIYCIATPSDGKFYIGSSNNMRRRCSEHVRELKAHCHSNGRLQSAWNAQGPDAFVFIPVCSVIDPESQFEIEEEFLDTLKPFRKSVGYNICSIPKRPPVLGKERIEQSMRKRKEFYRQNPQAWELLCKSRRKPRLTPRSEATRQKLSVALTGQKRTPEQCQRIADAKMGTKMPAVFTEKRRKFLTGRVGAQASASKTYTFISPDGTEEQFIGMAESCREHGLDSRAMFRILKGQAKQHKGWTVPDTGIIVRQ